MSRRPAFANHLVGTSSHRPPFFYAYLAIWLHAAAGAVLLLPFMRLPIAEGLAVLLLASLCFGVIIYALSSRQYDLLVNLVAYGLNLHFIFTQESRTFLFLLCAALVSFASTYLLLGREYRFYNKTEDRPTNAPLPWWARGLVGCLLVFFFFYGISMFLI